MSDESEGGKRKKRKRKRPANGKFIIIHAIHLLRNHALTKIILYFPPSK